MPDTIFSVVRADPEWSLPEGWDGSVAICRSHWPSCYLPAAFSDLSPTWEQSWTEVDIFTTFFLTTWLSLSITKLPNKLLTKLQFCFCFCFFLTAFLMNMKSACGSYRCEIPNFILFSSLQLFYSLFYFCLVYWLTIIALLICLCWSLVLLSRQPSFLKQGWS